MLRTEPTTPYDVEPLIQLSRDLREAARTLSSDEVRFLVQTYYVMQGERIRASQRVERLAERQAPHSTLDWLLDQFARLERNIRATLAAYTANHVVGAWSQSLVGIGPVLSAGLLAYIDIERAPTVGHIWRFAGLDPTVTWKKGEPRPWNAGLKTLCYKIGESFVKTANREGSFYGPLYMQRKALEIERNLSGAHAEQAKAILRRRKFKDSTDAKIWMQGRLTVEAARMYYAAPAKTREGLARQLAGRPGSGVRMLPPAHIHARARRWVVKRFLADWHCVAYWVRFHELPPKPWVIEHGGHVHYAAPPLPPESDAYLPGLRKALADRGAMFV